MTPPNKTKLTGKELSPKDRAEIVTYLLVSVYNELKIKSHACEACDDVYDIWCELKRCLDEYGLKVDQLTSKSS